MWFDVKMVELQLERFSALVSDVCACYVINLLHAAGRYIGPRSF